LRKQEGEIFGDNNNRSKFTLFTNELRITKGQSKPTPHRSFQIPCMTVGSTFEVVLRLPVETLQWDLGKCKALFELTCILGDFGKRARRGMGSVHITNCKITSSHPKWLDFQWEQTPVTISRIHNLLQTFSSFYTIRNNAIYHQFSGSMQYYPWIRQIELGKPNANLLMRISDTTHNIKASSTLTYEASLGHAKGGRFASPIYVTAIKGSLRPLITTLNTVPDRPQNHISGQLQERFKQNIL